MKLIPEQIEGIKKQIAEKINVVSDVDYLEESREEFKKNVSECGVRDEVSERHIFKAHADIARLRIALEDAEIVDEPTGSIIEIGSNFTVEFSTGTKRIFTLVETTEGLEKTSDYTTKASPFGQAIIGKTEGDVFSYTIGTSPFNKRQITGCIEKINTKENTNSKQKTITKK